MIRWVGVVVMGLCIGAGARHAAPLSASWSYAPNVLAAPVTDSAGHSMIAPWLGGFDVPRPQLVDLRGTGTPDLFVQEWPGQIIQFERVAGQ